MMELTKILNKIQTELKTPKSNYNSFGKYKYRSCEDITEAVKPLLKETGAVLTLSDEIIYLEGRFYIKAVAKLSKGLTSIETKGYAREEESKKGMDGAQVTGGASSYARKYALNGLFAIDDTKDGDATNQGNNATYNKPKPTTTTKVALASPEQVEKINKLFKDKKLPQAQIDKQLTTVYKVNKVAELTETQAFAIINKLEVK